MSVGGELEVPPNDGELSRCGLKTVPDRERPEGTHRVLKSRVGSRLGAGAAGDGDGADLLENGLERMVAGGLLGLNEGREGDTEGDRLGVNEGRDGAIAGGLLGLNDGLEGAIEGDLPELNGELGLRDGPGLGLGLGLMASRLAAMPLSTALRSEPPRAAITLGVACRRLDGRRPASEKPAW